MTVVNVNNVSIPLHWNDRFYESPECAECGEEIWTRTITEMVEALENHYCKN